MTNKRSHIKTHLTYASPWILTAAIGLLLAIVAFFAVNNLQREKRIMTESLFNKGQAILRFVGAGTRASMMMGAPSLPAQVQSLIEQASGESGILYIAVVDQEQKIVAHSDPEKIGTRLPHSIPTYKELPPLGTHQILPPEHSEEDVFEIIARFEPFRRGQGRFSHHRRKMMERFFQNQKKQEQSPSWCQPQEGQRPWDAENNHLIIVGLDMSDQQKVIQQNLLHMIYMSIAVLLVGIGSWIALLTAQGYKTSQKTLMHMQAFTSLLINRLPVGIIATNQEGQIESFNKAAQAMTDKKAEEVLQKTATKVLPEQLLPFFGDSLKSEAFIEQELLFPVAEDESSRQLMVNSGPITDQKGITIGQVALLYDVTEIKNLESQVRRQDRLVALGKMAAGVAHEVRNPLSSIKGFATLLGSRFAQESEEKGAADLMVKEVERLNRSITELLNYARPLPLEIREQNLKTVIEDSLKLIQSDANSLDIKTICEVDDEQASVWADPDRLNQVLLNLYLNAMQAMPNGGELMVQAQLEPDQELTIRITDSGVGIAEESLERVMDPYFTTKADGTGLGLALAQKIVDEHGGKIRMESKEGVETTVTITLPAKG